MNDGTIITAMTVPQFKAPSYGIMADNLFVLPAASVATDRESKELIFLRKTVNRLEQNISFIQREHAQMLTDLQQQVDKLREENKDLQFQLIMRSSRLNDGEHLVVNANVLPANHSINKRNDIDINDASVNQISTLKQMLHEERAKNKNLIEKLKDLESMKTEGLKPKPPSDEIPGDDDVSSNECIEISDDLRICLNPLTISKYLKDSGKFSRNLVPTIEDCEYVIKTLLEKSDNLQKQRKLSLKSHDLDREDSIPIIKRPLQSLKPVSRGSAPTKLSPLSVPYCSNSYKVSSTSSHKLIPLLPQRLESTKLETNSQRTDVANRSEIDKRQTVFSHLSDGKTGTSLPALPKPIDFNQAEKQRRLQSIQKKRLDHLNNNF